MTEYGSTCYGDENGLGLAHTTRLYWVRCPVNLDGCLDDQSVENPGRWASVTKTRFTPEAPEHFQIRPCKHCKDRGQAGSFKIMPREPHTRAM